MASLVKLLVVMKTPRLACAPCRAPTNPWISGRPTVCVAAYRLACTSVARAAGPGG